MDNEGHKLLELYIRERLRKGLKQARKKQQNTRLAPNILNYEMKENYKMLVACTEYMIPSTVNTSLKQYRVSVHMCSEGYDSRCICLSVCLFIKPHFISRASVHPKKHCHLLSGQ